MSLRIITADERLSASENKTSLAVFGPPGVGKTTLIKTLPADKAVCFDLEAGMKSVQDWHGPSIPIRSFPDFRDLVILIGGPDPAQHPGSYYGADYHAHVQREYAESGLETFLKDRSIIFVDSITDLTRQAMAYAKQQPEAFSDRTGKPDVRGAYGLLGREVIQALKHLQHARGKTVIFVGVLEKITDEFGTSSWVPQMEGTKAGRELPGIVDQVLSMQLFGKDAEGAWTLDEKSTDRRLVCQSGNPWGLPAKDRSGRLDITEPPDLAALLAKIDGRSAPISPITPTTPLSEQERTYPMNFDLNDAGPQMAPMGELIPDGTFAKVMMKLRPGGANGASEMDAGLLKASPHSDAKMLDCEFTVTEGPYARRKFWQNFTVAGGKLDEKGQSKGWNISKSAFRAMIDSALGLKPDDLSEAARAKRVIGGLRQLDGITFAARIMVDVSDNPNYRDSNKIANVVLPNEPAYAATMRGEAVAPEPVNAPPRKSAAAVPAAWNAQAPAQAGWSNAPQAPAAQAQPGTPAPAATPGGAPAWLNS